MARFWSEQDIYNLAQLSLLLEQASAANYMSDVQLRVGQARAIVRQFELRNSVVHQRDGTNGQRSK